jgi:tetratricopeptide (TPR) repeat protein
MGVVYVAEQKELKRKVAVKVMKAGVESPRNLRRFELEAEALGRLQHEGIAHVYAADPVGKGDSLQPYLAMELIQGQPLTVYADTSRLARAARLRLMLKVCQAVQYAHENGVIHRDLKPGNILVDQTGQPKIVDFGVALVTGSNSAESAHQPNERQFLGTFPYMSPEQAAEVPEELTTRSDVYTLGVICYELLTGRLPYDLEGKRGLAALRVIREQEPTPLRAISKAFRGDLDAILAKALEKDKSRRYRSAQELADDLERCVHGKAVVARAGGAFYHLGKLAKANKVLFSAAGIALVLGVLALLAGNWLWTASTLERERANLAEKEKSLLEKERDLLQADRHVQNARLAAQSGQWRTAVVNYDKALAAGYGDLIGLRLDKIRALIALADDRRYMTEIEALARMPNLGQYEASVWLLQGDILLGRDDAQAEQLIRRAQEKGLPPDGRAYAQALLAESTPEAVAHLQQAVQLDPHRPDRRASLELLLLLLGRLPEARVELATHLALFPDDLRAKVLWAALYGLERDLPSANATLDSLRGELSEDDHTAVKALVQLWSEIRNPANPRLPEYGLPDLMSHFLKAAPHFKRLWQLRPGADPGDLFAAHQDLIRTFPLGPRLRNVLLQWVRPIVVSMNNPKSEQTMRVLTTATAIHPEGTLLYWRALALFGNVRLAEAEKAALMAAETPAIFLVRQPALYLAFASECGLYPSQWREDLQQLTVRTVGLMASPLGQAPLLASAGLAPGIADNRGQALLRRAIENYRKARALGPLPFPKTRELPIGAALFAREYSLARELLDDWEREAPDDTRPLFWRIRTELAAGSNEKALEAAERVLKQMPDDPVILRLRKLAIENLIKQARPHLPGAPVKP